MADIIQIGDLVLQRKHRQFITNPKECQHHRLELVEHGEYVRCSDCNQQVSMWWALNQLSTQIDRHNRAVERREKAVAEAKDKTIHLIAAQKVEKVWRSRTMAPTCPHCNAGILPEDGLGSGQVSKEWELKRRAAKENGTK